MLEETLFVLVEGLRNDVFRASKDGSFRTALFALASADNRQKSLPLVSAY